MKLYGLVNTTIYFTASIFVGSLLTCESARSAQPAVTETSSPHCHDTIRAEVAALELPYIYNRFGSYNPAGLIYALRQDLVFSPEDQNDVVAGLKNGDPIPVHADTAIDAQLVGNVKLREGKRPRPLVLRVNEGDCLDVSFTNLLPPIDDAFTEHKDAITGRSLSLDSEQPLTRKASMHVNGLDYVNRIGPDGKDLGILNDGANVGYNTSSLADVGETVHYTWYGKAEGGYLFYSMAAPAGGEGDGGQLGLGLFGSVNVEPAGSKWYRSQLTGPEFAAVYKPQNRNSGQPIIDFDNDGRDTSGRPYLNILDPKTKEIVHSDLNAVIDSNSKGENCVTLKDDGALAPGATCGVPFREFTVIFHDEMTVQQAFPELDNEGDPIHSLRDGMGINYGSAGLGAMVLANRRTTRTGPAADCKECKVEEFFLSSWVMGDPAMIVERDETTSKVVKALYPDDPSNVHHSYVGDPIRFRNIHAGPKETHVFHLHAHQWLQDRKDDKSTYLDSQTISPGSSFSYEIHWGGSGNRNVMPGDSIFHCHLYPHFAQGMWELWRSHDVLESGTADRNLPDNEIVGGTPNPAILPLPGSAMPPPPTLSFKGYPFYIAGVKGHRPPQPPLDLEQVNGETLDGGLPRHVVVSEDENGNPTPALRLSGIEAINDPDIHEKYFVPNAGIAPSAIAVAQNVRSLNNDDNNVSLASKLVRANLKLLPLDGTSDEKNAMKHLSGKDAGAVDLGEISDDRHWSTYVGYPTCRPDGTCDKATDPADKRILYRVNGYAAKPGAPFSEPCPPFYRESYLPNARKITVNDRNYRAAYVQYDMTVNKAGWHDPQTRSIVLERDVKDTISGVRSPEPFFFRAVSGECVNFHVTNLMPSNLNIDDFQVFTPTDTIGQHIHLVKFDVTSSDGSANGFNYEDATFSPEEVTERIAAYNNFKGSTVLTPKTHPMFRAGGAMAGDWRGICPTSLNEVVHPWCGAQTTVQRWWADPILTSTNDDKTIRSVFTHDHLGPSSHQQHGLYAALVVEPPGATWTQLDGTPMGGVDFSGRPDVVRPEDGGPTSYAANIKVPSGHFQGEWREYNMAVADFVPLYTKAPENHPVNPTNRIDHDLPNIVYRDDIPKPEGISTSDPGGQLVNYRNEPVPLRIASEGSDGRYHQKSETDIALACKQHVISPHCSMSDPGTCALNRQNSAGEITTDYRCRTGDAECLLRACGQGDTANVFSSVTHSGQSVDPKLKFPTEPAGARKPGDPATPILSAYDGDKVQIRLVQGSQEENHIFTMHGLKWLSEADDPRSGYRNGQHIGISEHFEFNVAATSSSPSQPVDYLYASSATDNYWDGMWGILRSFQVSRAQTDLKGKLKQLSSSNAVQTPGSSLCPENTPTRYIDVDAINDEITYREASDMKQKHAIRFVKTDEAYETGIGDNQTRKNVRIDNRPSKTKEPLILRAAAGDCIKVTLHNKLSPLLKDNAGTLVAADDRRNVDRWSHNMLPPITDGFNFNSFNTSQRVGLHAQLVAVNPLLNDGANVGFNSDTTVPPGGHKEYEWYAGDFEGQVANQLLPERPRELGAIGLSDPADVIKAGSLGAVGALIIEPQGATWETDCDILYDPDDQVKSNEPCLESAATVQYLKDGKKQSFREFTIILQNDVSMTRNGQPIANLRNGDDAEDSGQKTVNYRLEPLWARLGAHPGLEPNDMASYDMSDVMSSKVHGDPVTPIFTTAAGQDVRIRLVEPAGHPRNTGFAVFGHNWPTKPWDDDSKTQVIPRHTTNIVGQVTGMGPARHENLLIGPAGGAFHVPGDYLYRAQEGFAFSGGMWGLLRVIDSSLCKDNKAEGDKKGKKNNGPVEESHQINNNMVCW
jgi:manganese oxidase